MLTVAVVESRLLLLSKSVELDPDTAVIPVDLGPLFDTVVEPLVAYFMSEDHQNFLMDDCFTQVRRKILKP